MYLLYSLAIVLFFIVVSPYFVYQALRYRKYVGSLPQRVGVLPLTLNLDGDESIWLHAVSVGEVLTARALIGGVGELYPRAVKAASESGHEIADHMWEHRVPKEPTLEEDHLAKTVAALERVSGRRPSGTRPPSQDVSISVSGTAHSLRL